MSATVKPVYDQNGYDCGLWRCYDTSDGYERPAYDNLTLFMTGNLLIVGQFPDWDNVTYDEDGCIDSEHVPLGAFPCPNPYEDDDAAGVLLEWLEDNEKAKEVW